MPSFHLSLPVLHPGRSAEFFETLGGTVTHRDPSGYVNVDLFGVQLTLTAGDPVKDEHLHLGVNVNREDFEAVAERLRSSDLAVVVIEPQVVDEGTPLERVKMYVRCPAGYLIELKGVGA